MDIGESQKDYQKLGNALKAMIKSISPKSSPKTLHAEMDRILDLAEKIGHPLLEDVKELKLAFDRMVGKPGDAQLAAGNAQLADSFLKLVLRLEQETREI